MRRYRTNVSHSLTESILQPTLLMWPWWVKIPTDYFTDETLPIYDTHMFLHRYISDLPYLWHFATHFEKVAFFDTPYCSSASHIKGSMSRFPHWPVLPCTKRACHGISLLLWHPQDQRHIWWGELEDDDCFLQHQSLNRSKTKHLHSRQTQLECRWRFKGVSFRKTLHNSVEADWVQRGGFYLQWWAVCQDGVEVQPGAGLQRQIRWERVPAYNYWGRL